MTTTLQAYPVAQVMNDYRATPATYVDSSGTLQDAPINSLLLDYDPTTLILRGYVARESRTNLIRNPRMVGAAAGSPGTAPTNWTLEPGTQGIIASIVNVGVENGRDFIDVNFAGTITAAGIGITYLETTTGAPIAANTNYTYSAGFKLLSGSMSNFNLTLGLTTLTSAGANDQVVTSSNFGATGTLAWQTFTLLTNSTAAYIRPSIGVAGTVIGGVVNATIRIYDPSCEVGTFRSTTIRPPAGTIATAVRGGDDIRLSLQSAWLDGVADTILVEATLPQAAPSGQDQGLFRLDDGTDANKFVLVNVAGGTSIHAQLTLGGTLVSDLTLGAMVPGSPFRVIAGYSLTVGSGVTAGIVSGGNRAAGAPAVASVPTFTRALVGRSSLNAGRAIEESARHANGQIAEIMIAKGVVLDENTMLYMSQMNLTVGVLLANSGVVLGGS
ncbi:hypothetical protein [Acidisoma sp. 7E03]